MPTHLQLTLRDNIILPNRTESSPMVGSRICITNQPYNLTSMAHGVQMMNNTTKHLWPRGAHEQEYYQTPVAQGCI